MMTYWLNSSVQKLVAFANVASKGETGPIPDIGSKELSTLANAMGQMRDELQGKRYIEQYAQALAHELKSPLSAITASAEFLSDPDLKPDQRVKFGDLLNAQTVRMRQSIDSMLAAARMEKTILIAKPSAININGLLSECIGDYQALCDAKNIRLVTIFATENIQIMGDSTMLKLAISNVLSNAVNFSSNGKSIEVSLSRKASTCEITVTDEGPGIPEYAKAHIGEQFYSLAQPDGTKGSGLGLRIATQIIKLHGGTLSVLNRAPSGTSQHQYGCIVTIRL